MSTTGLILKDGFNGYIGAINNQFLKVLIIFVLACFDISIYFFW